ncbi:MAG TPA: excalibur calcium-binding domain-containing protein [Solirubrobacterales bacterium]|nr:excalibur calcium-binding domain-containing protein [Solirubrobacterales bacterium]
MKPLFAALLALTAAAFLLPTSAAAATDYDCADFANQAEAQEYLLPGDPYRLDGDGDGIACEDLPCPCSYGEGSGGDGSTDPPYRLTMTAARQAARPVAREFARRNPKVSSVSLSGCERLGERRIDCHAIARGSTSTSQTTCRLRIAVRAVNQHPKARLAASSCQTRFPAAA